MSILNVPFPLPSLVNIKHVFQISEEMVKLVSFRTEKHDMLLILRGISSSSSL